MRKKVLGIVGGLVAVAALGTATFLLLKNDPGEESSSELLPEESSGTEVQLTSQEPENVVSIDVHNAAGDFEVVRVTEAEGENDAVYAVAGWEDLPLDTSLLWTLSNNTASMRSSDVVVENCEELEKFALDEKNAQRVTLHFDDGSSYAFRIGSAISGSGMTYLAAENEDTVYTVQSSLVSNFSKAPMEFLSKTVLAEPAEEDYPTINYTKVERQDLDCVLQLDYDTAAEDEENLSGTVASHIMTSPVPAYLSVERSTPIVTGLFGLTADAVVVPHPSDAEKTQYGLSEDFGTVTMDCDDGNTYVLHMSQKQTSAEGTDCYYAYLDGVDAIYQFTAENLPWVTVTPTDIASKLVFSTYVWDIGNLKVRAGDQQLDFTVKATNAEDAVVQVNGKDTDAERYRQFYTFLLNTTAENIDWKTEPSGTPQAEILIATRDGKFRREFAIYVQDDFTCLITVDGKPAYTCRKSYLDVLTKNIGVYDSNEEFTLTWS